MWSKKIIAREDTPIKPQGESFNLDVTHTKAVEALSRLDPEEIEACSLAPYRQNSFSLTFLNNLFRIAYPSGEITKEGGEPVSLYLSILLLHYLITADGRPLSGEWVSFRHLPGGNIYQGPFQKRALLPLTKSFGDRPAEFTRAAAALGGSPGSFRGVSAVIPVFPRVPLAFILWPGDDEFPATANILFDASAPSYLPTEDYAHLPALIIAALKNSL